MGEKTIKVSEAVFQRLKRLKRPRESMSTLILRLTKPYDLMEFAGVISNQFASELHAAVASTRQELGRSWPKKGPRPRTEIAPAGGVSIWGEDPEARRRIMSRRPPDP